MVDDNIIGNGKGWLLYLAGADADVSLMHVEGCFVVTDPRG